MRILQILRRFRVLRISPVLRIYKVEINFVFLAVKKAEVAAWFKNFDEAERLYLEADMRSLAVRMRKRLGDWFKVVQLLKTGSGGNDAEMEEAYNEVRM